MLTSHKITLSGRRMTKYAYVVIAVEKRGLSLLVVLYSGGDLVCFRNMLKLMSTTKHSSRRRYEGAGRGRQRLSTPRGWFGVVTVMLWHFRVEEDTFCKSIQAVVIVFAWRSIVVVCLMGGDWGGDLVSLFGLEGQRRIFVIEEY